MDVLTQQSFCKFNHLKVAHNKNGIRINSCVPYRMYTVDQLPLVLRTAHIFLHLESASKSNKSKKLNGNHSGVTQAVYFTQIRKSYYNSIMHHIIKSTRKPQC